MFSTTCRIIVFACVPERAADLPMRSFGRTIHLFDSGRLGQSQGLDADTAFLAAVAQNIKRLARFLSQPTTPTMEAAT